MFKVLCFNFSVSAFTPSHDGFHQTLDFSSRLSLPFFSPYKACEQMPVYAFHLSAFDTQFTLIKPWHSLTVTAFCKHMKNSSTHFPYCYITFSSLSPPFFSLSVGANHFDRLLFCRTMFASLWWPLFLQLMAWITSAVMPFLKPNLSYLRYKSPGFLDTHPLLEMRWPIVLPTVMYARPLSTTDKHRLLLPRRNLWFG